MKTKNLRTRVIQLSDSPEKSQENPKKRKMDSQEGNSSQKKNTQEGTIPPQIQRNYPAEFTKVTFKGNGYMWFAPNCQFVRNPNQASMAVPGEESTTEPGKNRIIGKSISRIIVMKKHEGELTLKVGTQLESGQSNWGCYHIGNSSWFYMYPGFSYELDTPEDTATESDASDGRVIMAYFSIEGLMGRIFCNLQQDVPETPDVSHCVSERSELSAESPSLAFFDARTGITDKSGPVDGAEAEKSNSINVESEISNSKTDGDFPKLQKTPPSMEKSIPDSNSETSPLIVIHCMADYGERRDLQEITRVLLQENTKGQSNQINPKSQKYLRDVQTCGPPPRMDSARGNDCRSPIPSTSRDSVFSLCARIEEFNDDGSSTTRKGDMRDNRKHSKHNENSARSSTSSYKYDLGRNSNYIKGVPSFEGNVRPIEPSRFYVKKPRSFADFPVKHIEAPLVNCTTNYGRKCDLRRRLPLDENKEGQYNQHNPMLQKYLLDVQTYGSLQRLNSSRCNDFRSPAPSTSRGSIVSLPVRMDEEYSDSGSSKTRRSDMSDNKKHPKHNTNSAKPSKWYLYGLKRGTPYFQGASSSDGSAKLNGSPGFYKRTKEKCSETRVSSDLSPLSVSTPRDAYQTPATIDDQFVTRRGRWKTQKRNLRKSLKKDKLRQSSTNSFSP